MAVGNERASLRPALAVAIAAGLLIASPSAAQNASPQPVQLASDSGADPSASDDQRVRCRRLPVTGSLVRVERVCKTVAEWRRLSDRGNDVVRRQFEDGLICSGGPCRGIEPPE